MDIFKIKHNDVAPRQGKILISEPFSKDSYFGRSVILITDYTREEGSVGLILNKPLEVTINDIILDFPEFSGTVYAGGPVNTERVFMLHTLGDIIPNSVHVIGDLYWGGDFDAIKLMIAANRITEHQLCFFVGYSGWAPEQLESELSQDSWLVTDTPSHQILEDSRQTIWKDTLRNMKKHTYRLWADYPQDPSWN